MAKRKRIYGDGPRVGRDRSGPGTAPPPRGRGGTAPTLVPKPKTSSLLERAAGEGAITDAEGLERAYTQGDAYTHGTTTYCRLPHGSRLVG